jgi:hypothetical protein
VYIYPNTKVRIGSIFVEIGKIFVRVKGLFEVRTDLVTAGSEGTEYWVEVSAQQQVNVGVVEDVVKLSSNAARWPAIKLTQNNKAATNAGNAPRVVAASAEEIQRERDWIRRMDNLYPIFERPKGGISINIGIGGGIGGGQRGETRGDNRETPQVPGRSPIR